MKIAITTIAIFLAPLASRNNSLELTDHQRLDFRIIAEEVFGNKIHMYYALLDSELNSVRCDFSGVIDFHEHMLPLDIHNYYERRGEENYYTLLTKTVYGLNQQASYFSRERLSDVDYLRRVMPHNHLHKRGENYDLNVGFGAPDISYTLDFKTNEEFACKYPELFNYFKKFDHIDSEPAITVLQHNHTFGKVLGHKTTKMSISVTRYFDVGDRQTLVINYTLNFIHNLPPALFGGSNLMINQMKNGIVALVRDTRSVCQSAM